MIFRTERVKRGWMISHFLTSVTSSTAKFPTGCSHAVARRLLELRYCLSNLSARAKFTKLLRKLAFKSAGGGGVPCVFGNYHGLQTLAQQGACRLTAADRYKTLMENNIAVDEDNSGV
jgi:hypothetical protein